MTLFEQKAKALRQQHEELLTRKNELATTADSFFGTFRFSQNGIYEPFACRSRKGGAEPYNRSGRGTA